MPWPFSIPRTSPGKWRYHERPSPHPGGCGRNFAAWLSFPLIWLCILPLLLLGAWLAIDSVLTKGTEADPRESERTYRSLFEGMLNGYAHCRMLFEQGEPVDFIYLHVNRAFETSISSPSASWPSRRSTASTPIWNDG